jgi:RHS repeat-associated protein
VQYRYGADGQRALKHVMSSGRVTVYFNKMWQTSNARADWLQGKHVYVGEERLVTKYNSEGNDNTQAEQTRTYYYHSDHLGSAQVVTNYQGQIHERLEYTPYGELWIDWRSADAPEDGTPYRFTGKELDPETGLYYYGARYLDPKTSRWISGDPALGEYIPVAPVNDEAKKQNQNLPGQGGVFNYVNLHVYHYAGNNPVKYTDPDGRDDEPVTDLSKIDDKIKVDMLTDVLGNLSQYLLENSSEMAEAYNGLLKDDATKMNNLADEAASIAVDIRKQYFAMNGDTDMANGSPDYQMYVDSVKEIAQKINIVNGGVMKIGLIHAGIQKLLNPKSISKYEVHPRSVQNLSNALQKAFTQIMRR